MEDFGYLKKVSRVEMGPASGEDGWLSLARGGFVPEQRSRYVFFEFRHSNVLSLWTFDVRFTHSHIMAMVQYP